MIFLHHKNANEIVSVKRNGEELEYSSTGLSGVFWEVCNIFPEDLIIWIDDEVELEMNDNLSEIFSHDLIMSSYSVASQFLPETIGYVDQLPFVNPDYNVKYPTWRMSTDVGGIKAKTALQFQSIYGEIKNFGLLLNSIAKTGQQNSLFCYSDPSFVKNLSKVPGEIKGGTGEIFNFVAMHYKREWLIVLLFCYWKYENRFPVFSFLNSMRQRSFFKKTVGISPKQIKSKNRQDDFSIDIIIPTLFRPDYIKDLLEDLRNQSVLPKRVIIVEQNPNKGTSSDLQFLYTDWPFEVVHHFIHRTGACHARNIALNEVKSKWVLFADDDIRIEQNLIEKAISEIERLGVGSLNLNSLQPGEKTVFPRIKQWGAFGSANAIVKSDYALRCKFSHNLEFGFGEDIDYGMQLRKIGCDIVYHPELKFIHLKAERGGFRTEGINEWKDQKIEPKPSPTMMFLVRKYYTDTMMKGYKTSLFLKFYRKQAIKNPFCYFEMMQNRWKSSEELCDALRTNKGS